ncbi:MAG: hypothetical protein HY897_01485 [Deltaproteobacteria bacterium]|nr:hypothetical protein [Deltaproteobacteria bacterium]
MRYYAAVSLVLMGARKYSPQALKIIEAYHRGGKNLNIGDLHPIVEAQFTEIKARFEKAFADWKSSTR